MKGREDAEAVIFFMFPALKHNSFPFSFQIQWSKMFHFLFIRSGVFDSVFAKFAKVLAKEISGCHRRNGVFQISLYSVIFCRQDILISWLANPSFIFFKLQFVYHLNAHNRILYVVCNILRWSCFFVCFLPQEFLLEAPPVSPLLRLYCIVHYSIHFTLEWSTIQVLTMAQVA